MLYSSTIVVSIAQTIFQRGLSAVSNSPNTDSWIWLTSLFLVYALLTLTIGFYSGFLHQRIPDLLWPKFVGIIAFSLLFPAIFEEIIFRVTLLPHLVEQVSIETQVCWHSISLLLFVLSHPLNAFSFFPASRQTFTDPKFLILAALLGETCAIAYTSIGSLWPPVFIHWLAVVLWLLLLGGYDRLYS